MEERKEADEKKLRPICGGRVRRPVKERLKKNALPGSAVKGRAQGTGSLKKYLLYYSSQIK